MMVSRYKYKIEILALLKPKNYLIQVSRSGMLDTHFTVGPRDSLSGTIIKIQQSMEKPINDA